MYIIAVYQNELFKNSFGRGKKKTKEDDDEDDNEGVIELGFQSMISHLIDLLKCMCFPIFFDQKFTTDCKEIHYTEERPLAVLSKFVLVPGYR